jgi:hypothetical protein
MYNLGVIVTPGVKRSFGLSCLISGSCNFMNANVSALRNNKKENPTAVCLCLLEGAGGVSDKVMKMLTKGVASIWVEI